MSDWPKRGIVVRIPGLTGKWEECKALTVLARTRSSMSTSVKNGRVVLSGTEGVSMARNDCYSFTLDPQAQGRNSIEGNREKASCNMTKRNITKVLKNRELPAIPANYDSAKPAVCQDQAFALNARK
ncbi:hypothetical protein DFH09DRAFT_1086629 [Mycena vulgaris]|nr:hypothetical protein DFH09DRAFT_1086629 [Mycena vulgaris]